MEERGTNKKLFGSVSVVTALVMITGTAIPMFYLGTQSEKEYIQGATKDWDIIVPDQYDTIEEAIENAEEGYRIFVRKGEYKQPFSMYSSSLSINKDNLTIQGEDKDTTIINGLGSKVTLRISADNIYFGGFTVINRVVNGTCMDVNTENSIIFDNILEAKNFVDGTEYVITLFNSNYNNISNNIIKGADKGIAIVGSCYNLFENNTITKNSYGIDFGKVIAYDPENRITERLFLLGPQGNKIIKNIIINNRYDLVFDSCNDTYFCDNELYDSGITLSKCENMHIINNTFDEDGIEIWGDKLVYYIHEIVNNTINGKPIYYYLDKEDFDVPTDAGQVILINCDEVNVHNLNINDTSTGILIAFSTRIHVRYCEINNNYQGVYLYYSTSTLIQNNNFIDNTRHAFFVNLGRYEAKTNDFKANYWDKRIGLRERVFQPRRYKVYGKYFLKHPLGLIKNRGFGIRTRNIDYFPYKNPIDIKN